MLDARSIVHRLVEEEEQPSSTPQGDELHIDPTELVVNIRGYAQGVPERHLYLSLLNRLPKTNRLSRGIHARLWQHRPTTAVYDLHPQAHLPHFDRQMEIHRSVLPQAYLTNVRKIAKATYLLLWEDKAITLRYHNTDIMTVTPDNKAEVYVGQFLTNTSRRRLNDYLPSGWQLYTLSNEWFWYNMHTGRGTYASGYRIPFSNNDIIDANTGELISQDEPQQITRHSKRLQWP